MTKAEQIKRRKEIYTESVQYYRLHPDEFCVDVLGIKLILYQVLMLRAFFKYTNICYVMGRGIGKSFTSMVCLVCYALLYPGAKIGIISGSFRQSRKVIEEKYRNELYERSPFLRQEEKSYTCSVQSAKITFYNNSFIEAFPLGSGGGGEKIRGARLHVCLIDEAAYVPQQIIDDVIFPMTIVEQGFEVGKKMDQDAVSNNKILMASSASYRSNHLYKTYKEWTEKMLEIDNKEFFTMTLPYTVGVKAGFIKQSKVDLRKAAMSETSFATEYLGIFPKLMDGVWIKPDDYLNCKNLLHIETEGSSKYDYVMSVDVARVKGQDNTIIMVFKLHWFANHVEADLVYIKSLNGCPFGKQAKYVRETLHKFPTTIRIYMDTMTIGQGLTDELAKEYTDDYTGETEPPIIDMNDEVAMKNKEATKGIPLIYGIKATAEINHRCGYAVKVWTEKGWLHLYAENAGDDDHMSSEKEFSSEELSILEENKATQEEVLSMEAVNLSSGYMKFSPRGDLKDRWSALGYGLYGIQLIKKERDEKNKRGVAMFAMHRR